MRGRRIVATAAPATGGVSGRSHFDADDDSVDYPETAGNAGNASDMKPATAARWCSRSLRSNLNASASPVGTPPNPRLATS